MSEELKPCPFCGGKPEIHTQMVSRYQFVSCSRCRCDGPLKEHTRGAISHWNRRASPTTECEGEAREAAKRIVEFDPVHGDEWSDALAGDAVTVARALLSSPRVEDVRREALEEAAARLEVLAIDYEERAEVSAADRHYSTAAYQKREADTLLIASTLIRSLSPPDGDGKQEQATRSPEDGRATAPTDRL